MVLKAHVGPAYLQVMREELRVRFMVDRSSVCCRMLTLTFWTTAVHLDGGCRVWKFATCIKANVGAQGLAIDEFNTSLEAIDLDRE